MKMKSIILAVILLLSIVSTGVGQEASQPASQRQLKERFSLGPDFWYPNRFNVSDAFSDARTHYRKGELRAAQAEVNEASIWLTFLELNATGDSKRELEKAGTILDQIAEDLDGEKAISARRLNSAFAAANLAIARHHYSKANKLVEETELLNASRRLVSAADHLKNAASAADIAPSPIVGNFRDEYSPQGMVNESLVVTPEQLQEDLEALSKAMKELSAAMAPESARTQQETDK